MDFSSKIVAWYKQNKRDLPWRKTKDPYKIWLSEIILQQTRVDQGLPYYLKFVENFPTINELANADEDEVLRLWQGLGYYSRGRNLHYSAKIVVDEFDGMFPNTSSDIKKLKGVGDYTSAAIASFAFGEKIAPVDGNVIRVISRVFGIEDDISDAKTLKKINEIATDLLPDKECDTYNQGMMEFGAIQCKPKSPNCETCPFVKSCVSFGKSIVDKVPFKSKKVKVRNRFFNYLVFKNKDLLYLKKREGSDIWQNLYDFPLIERDSLFDFDSDFLRKKINTYGIKNNFTLTVSDDFKHILSHQKINARFFLIEQNQEFDFADKNLIEVHINEMDSVGKPILIQNYLNKYIL